MEHQAHPPPLGHCPRDVINLKNAPTLGHSQAPPLGHCPRDVIRPPKNWKKHPPSWTFTSTPPLGHCPCAVIHIFQGWNKIAKGWNKTAKGWNKTAKGWNKIAKGWNKIAKGWTKIFGMGNWGGGRPTPPTPPPLATGLHYLKNLVCLDQGFSTFFHRRTPGVYMIHYTYPQAEKNILFANITQHCHYI